VVLGNIGSLADVLVEVIEARLFFIRIGRLGTEILGLRGECQFPWALTNRLKGVSCEVEVRFSG
jgi:hypothetical protein